MNQSSINRINQSRDPLLYSTIYRYRTLDRFFLEELDSKKYSTARPKVYTRNTALIEVAENSPPTMVVRNPGDAQGGKRTSSTHDQHDPGKVKAFEGKDGPNRKEIGAKLIKNDKNGQIAGNIVTSTAAAIAADDQKMTREDQKIEQAKDEGADTAMVMELEA